eukprot:TRINITY_DN21504_c0_g1_i1.p1 TRINITY_DN21504_c0_g1~~TRINITY_DN21504_c0_g1_i1.p1  ORF type:complete len:265 (-),score=36.00 TRINITY_DN21504_c0_g1_i1:264-1058(-)
MDWSGDGMLPLDEDSDRPMNIPFSTLDGTTAVVGTRSGVTMGALRQEVAVALGLIEDSSALPPPFLMTLIPAEADSAEHAVSGDLMGGGIEAGKMLSDGSFASEAEGGAVLVAVTVEPADCRNKRFVYQYLRGRRCGMEEDEESVTLDLRAGGVFVYQRHDHSHDAECGYMYDRWQKGTGQWSFRDDGEGEDAGLILLTGKVEETVKQNRKKDSITWQDFRSSYRRKELLGKVRPSRGKWTSEQLPGSGQTDSKGAASCSTSAS